MPRGDIRRGLEWAIPGFLQPQARFWRKQNNLAELREVIRDLHRVGATHIESVPVKETFNGQVVWNGIVEVFAVIRHPQAERIYAWSQPQDTGRLRHVTVLHVPPVESPVTAVRAWIYRDSLNFLNTGASSH